MKKFLFLFLGLVLGVIGCVNGSDVLDAVNKMGELDNYKMVVSATADFSIEGYDFSMKIIMDSDVDEKNDVAKMITTVEFADEKETAESYMMFDGNKTITYTEMFGDWYKTTEPTISEEEMFEILKNVETVDKTTSGDITEYKVKLSGKDVEKLMGDMQMEEMSISFGETEFIIHVNKDGYITKMTLDLPMNMDFDGYIVSTTIKFNYTFSKFNQVGNIAIPQNIIDNAITSD